MRSVRMALGEVVTNLPPSTPGWKGLGNRSLDLLAPQPIQLMLKTRLLTLRRYSRFWDVLMNSRLVANAARNIEILRERSSENNKRNRDRDRIRPTAQGSNQRGYDQKGYDGRSYDRQDGNSNQKSWQNQGQQYNRSSGSSGQKGYPDYASSPPYDICGKLHLGKACHRVTGACFTCVSTGHMAKNCPKNGGNGGKGNGNDNQRAAKGRVFSLTKDQAANSSGTVSGTLSMYDRDVFV
ncbi:zinc finger, CCHC-type, retrotransposon gag domain protein [Tanacetum coccineum]